MNQVEGKNKEEGMALGFLPGPVLLLGAPGVGKGTQAKLLMHRFNIPQISTGDLLRQHRRDRTQLGLTAETLMEQGRLVPDELVNQMVADRLTHPDCQAGFILDGFPRTLAQADWLDRSLAEKPGNLPVVAISIVVDPQELLRRITGRRISAAGRIYNLYSHPPRVPGLCDVDGSTLEQRSDDTEPVFEQRMRTFAELTAPVIEHYRKDKRFAEIDGAKNVGDVTEAILRALRQFRATRPQENV